MRCQKAPAQGWEGYTCKEEGELAEVPVMPAAGEHTLFIRGVFPQQQVGSSRVSSKDFGWRVKTAM